MNNLFEEKRTLFLLLLCLVFLGLLAIYLFLLQPLSAELRSKKNINVSLEADIGVLESKQNPETQKKDIDILLMQKKVPLNPELEKLLLTFQEVEQTSGSRIEEIDFLYDGNEPEFDFEEENMDAAGDKDNETQEKSAAEGSNDENPDVGSKESTKPENLRLVTAKLTVLSPDYEHFMKFIKGMESVERITRVDKLEFLKPAEKEAEFQENPDETMAFTILVTTFYYEK